MNDEHATSLMNGRLLHGHVIFDCGTFFVCKQEIDDYLNFCGDFFCYV